MSDTESQQSGTTNNKMRASMQDTKQRNGDKNPFDKEPPRTAASSRDGDSNPFIIPEDKLCEMIFTFKDDEKQRKAEEKEANKNKRIWEKNRPVREGCLRKLCETDIEPSQLAINPKIKSKVNIAEFQGFTVPSERQKNVENRYKLIEKKREMFLVQQMLQTKDEEMERLADHNDQRQTGLHCAALMLETDTKSFLEFFAKIKQEQFIAGKELEKKTQERDAMSEKLKALQNKCSTFENGNNKTIDLFQQFVQYQEFINNLASEKQVKEMAQRKIKNKQRRVIERRERKAALEQKAKEKKLRLQARAMEQAELEQEMTSEEAQLAQKEFQKRLMEESSESEADDPDQFLDFKLGNDMHKKRLQQILNDSEDEYPFPFTKPEELLEIFTTLEDANLFLIQRTQENEKLMEDKQIAGEANMKSANADLAKMVEREKQVDERKQRVTFEKNTLSSMVSSNNVKQLEPHEENRIRKKVMDIYQDVRPSHQQNSEISILAQLLEIEKFCDDCHMFAENAKSYRDQKNGDPMKKLITAQVSKNRKQKNEDNLQAEIDAKEAANLQRKEDEKNRGKPFGGKMKMQRSEPPAFKKQETKKVIISQEKQDMIKYLGNIDPVPQKK